MDRSELDIIKELMAELESKMEPGKEDFENRLGRKKPDVQMVKIEGEMPSASVMDDEMRPEVRKMGGLKGGEGAKGDQRFQDQIDFDNSDHEAEPTHSGRSDGMIPDEMDPDELLKSRLMKLRS